MAKKLEELLLEARLITREQLAGALAEMKRWARPLENILLEMNLVPEESLVGVLSKHLNIPLASFEPPPTAQALGLVAVEFCDKHQVLPLRTDGRFLDLAMADPKNLSVADELRMKTRLNIHPFLAGPQALERAIFKSYHGRSMVGPVFVSNNDIVIDQQQSGRHVDPAAQAVPVAQAVARRPAAGGGGGGGGGGGPEPNAADPARGLDAKVLGRIEQLEAMLARDEIVIRKLMGLLIEKKIFSREELERRLAK